jgi:hypothetical protein
MNIETLAPEKFAGIQEAMKLSREHVYQFIWNELVAPKLQDALDREQERRADAFAPKAFFTVCGEEIRMMTPRDLVILDGFESPFIVGGAEPTEDDVIFFVWAMHRHNDDGNGIRTAWRRGRARGRVLFFLEQRGLAEAILEVFSYIERIFIDLPSKDPNTKEQQRPPAVHVVANLLVDVAAIGGPRDPMDGKFLGDTPIPRLIQYRRARQKAVTKDGAQASSFESAQNECMAILNECYKMQREGKI